MGRLGQGGSGAHAKGWLVALLAIAAAVVAFLVYSGALKNEFVWDDPIVLNQQLQAFHSLRDVFLPPRGIPQFGQKYYRPVIVLSYVVDRWLWGDTAFGFHFPVVVFHALNSALVFLVGLRLFGAERRSAVLAAAAGALLFATHPIHTESVYWMAGRSDTIAALFLLPALLAYLAWKRDRARWPWLIGAALLFLTGCFAKESAFGLLAIVLAADVIGVGGVAPREDAAVRVAAGGAAGPGRSDAKGRRSKRNERAKQPASEDANVVPEASISVGERIIRSIPGWAALGAATIVYKWMRNLALSVDKQAELQWQLSSLFEGLLNVLRAVGFYIVKAFAPIHLDAFIPTIPDPGFSLAVGLIGLATATVLGALAWRRGERTIAFLIAWFFGALAPSLTVAFFQVSEAPVAERYLYLPSVAFCLLLGHLAFQKIPRLLPARASRPALIAAFAAVLALGAAYAAATVDRGRVWRTDLEFWKDAVAKSPDEGLPHLHLGLAYANLDQDDLAEREYLLSLQANYDDEGRSIVLNNLGMLYLSRGDLPKADDYFQQALRMRPGYATPNYGLGMSALRQAEEASAKRAGGDARELFARAERHLRRAIEINPQYTKAHVLFGRMLHMLGRDREAMSHADRVLQLVGQGREFESAVKLRDDILKSASTTGEGGAGK